MLHAEFLDQINEILSNESLMSNVNKANLFGVDDKQALIGVGLAKGIVFSAKLLKEKGVYYRIGCSRKRNGGA